MKSIVIALGGNALVRHGEMPTFHAQYGNVVRAIRSISHIFSDSDLAVVITHGNGLQVGEEMLRGEYAKEKVPRLPLHALTAETQGLLGTMVQIAVMNELGRLKIRRPACTVLTHVLVNKGSKAFSEPTKPVGPAYSRRELEKELKAERFSYVEEGGGFRRVVASPDPKMIIEKDVIAKLLGEGSIVIACGGGGIPVVRERGGYGGVSAVLDKDLSTQVLASSIRADRMVMLTEADRVYADYANRAGPIDRIRASDLRKLVRTFESGTMRPKVRAAVGFIARGGSAAYIGNLFQFKDIVDGRAGTMVY